MTDRELLELIAQKVNGLGQKFNELDQKVTGMESRLTNIESRLTEHGEILTALRHSSEVHTAKLDNLEIELAKLSGEQRESFQALADMYGQHELEISKLRRKSS